MCFLLLSVSAESLSLGKSSRLRLLPDLAIVPDAEMIFERILK
jgi:hypothetical protein